MGPLAVNIDPYVEIWRAAEQAQFPVNPADTYDWNDPLCGMVDVGGKSIRTRVKKTIAKFQRHGAAGANIDTDRIIDRTESIRGYGTGYSVLKHWVARARKKENTGGAQNRRS
ncbi:hypothetical protein FB451DRAFT_1188739 [Mycena latifolia]|nr:hypothetical protein FB451DRAFT_1188739 [Mycena latifolia]